LDCARPDPTLANQTPLFNVKVSAAVLNIRSRPDTTFPVLRQVHSGDLLTVYDLGRQTVWVQIGPGAFCAFRYNGVGYLEPA
jgi:uncharacterized protein YgiM (DUF1202 family)